MIVYIVYGFNILISIATSTICPTKQTGHLSNLLLSVILGVFDSDIADISMLSMSSSAMFAILSPTEHIFCFNFHFYQMSDSILIILYSVYMSVCLLKSLQLWQTKSRCLHMSFMCILYSTDELNINNKL